jgi:sulfoxide reductase heme-binding subunit YedZ
MRPKPRLPGQNRLIVALAMLPPALLGVRALTSGLGANPIEEISHVTGDWSLRFLLLSLAVTPARRLLRLAWIAPLRRALGLAAFSSVCLHLLTYVALDQLFDWALLLEDLRERRYVMLGFAGFLCLVPLAVTSTRGWKKRLGQRWVTVHRLAYLAASFGVAHHLWLVKADLRPPLLHAAILALLLGSRVWRPGRGLSFRARPGRRRPPARDRPPRAAVREGSAALGSRDPP